MAEATSTTDHDIIRRWAEERGNPGILRIDFREPDEGLEEIPWDDWFQAFEDDNLAFLYQDEGDSRFNKLVDR